MENVISLFLNLVRIDSPTGEEDAICDYLRNEIQNLGFTPHTDSYGNIIVSIPGQGEPLLLTAHVDTVEPGRGVKPVIDGDTIRSDGPTILGADNKVGVAIIMDILSDYSSQKNRRALEVVFTRSEEIGNYGAVNLDYSLLKAKKGYAFDNPNPVGTIISAAPFYNRFDITIHGKSAHASKPEQGIHALTILTECMNQIQIGRVSDTALVNIGAIAGGHVRNTIMGELTINGEVRSMNEVEIQKYTDQIVQTFERVCLKYHATVTIDVVRENGGYEYQENDKDIQQVVSVMNEMSVIPVIKQDWGVADSNIFAEHGIKVLNLGDGTVLTHTTKEHISISDISRLKEIVVRVLNKR